MAEKVRDGIDGFHFDVGNHRSLARTLLKHADDKLGYDALQKCIQPPVSIDIIAADHLKLYRSPDQLYHDAVLGA